VSTHPRTLVSNRTKDEIVIEIHNGTQYVCDVVFKGKQCRGYLCDSEQETISSCIDMMIASGESFWNPFCYEEFNALPISRIEWNYL